jgi:hypothetical protein
MQPQIPGLRSREFLSQIVEWLQAELAGLSRAGIPRENETGLSARAFA